MATPITTAGPAKKGGWFQKVPRDILFTPGGAILVLLAGVIEAIDWIPIPVLDQILEIPLEILFLIFLSQIAGYSFKAMIIPFIIERIPGFSDIVPTWALKILGLF